MSVFSFVDGERNVLIYVSYLLSFTLILFSILHCQ